MNSFNSSALSAKEGDPKGRIEIYFKDKTKDYRQGEIKMNMNMNIAMIGYIFGDNKISVSYDTVNKKFLIEEEYKDRDIGIKIGFNYSVKSREEVRESLNRFKKSFNK